MGFKLVNVAGRAALATDEHYYDIAEISGGAVSHEPMLALAAAPELSALGGELAGKTPTGALADAELLAPVPNPPQCFGIGLNYRNHAEEAKMTIPEVPMVFTKFPSCVTGPNADIVLRSDFVDYEGELVAVIGKPAKDIAVADAWAHVAGLCNGQDVSDRAVQFASMPPQFNLGKSFDTFAPIGPMLVSVDALEDAGALRLTTRVNGELRQDDTTGDLIFDVPALVSYLSHIMTLNTGDLIFTGTPGGVGAVEGVFLRAGDEVVTSIEGLGTMTNRCVRGTDHPDAASVPATLAAMLPKKN